MYFQTTEKTAAAIVGATETRLIIVPIVAVVEAVAVAIAVFSTETHCSGCCSCCWYAAGCCGSCCSCCWHRNLMRLVSFVAAVAVVAVANTNSNSLLHGTDSLQLLIIKQFV